MYRKIIIPIIFGGIGNQLFIYAAAKRLAVINNAQLIIDNKSGFIKDFNYKRTYQLDNFNIKEDKLYIDNRPCFFTRVKRFLLRIINKRRNFNDSKYIVQRGMDFEPRLLEKKINNYLYLVGYWQSEDYCVDIENIIREDLTIKPPKDKKNIEMYEKISNLNSVALHLRFFDNPTISSANNATKDYYDRAIKRMDQLHQDNHYYIFSDRTDLVKGIIELPSSKYTVVTHNDQEDLAIYDLWLMTACKNFIIANSTFSWWGAWLSPNKEKIVIAPGFELKEDKTWWGFKGLIPKEWIKI
jgi:hypothetical protein